MSQLVVQQHRGHTMDLPHYTGDHTAGLISFEESQGGSAKQQSLVDSFLGCM